MASNVLTSEADEPEDQSPSPPPAPQRGGSHGGFFTIHKKGQGKWTRLGTIFAAAFLGLLTAFNLFYYLQPYIHSQRTLMGISVGFLAVFGLLVFWVSNKPSNVEFLIATDSEMKKVNWTTKGELFGSTRVVILFLFFIAIFLFLIDIVFAEFFYLISVLRTGPFQ